MLSKSYLMTTTLFCVFSLHNTLKIKKSAKTLLKKRYWLIGNIEKILMTF